jgi:putative tricarboxylic transport membrane protein
VNLKTKLVAGLLAAAFGATPVAAEPARTECIAGGKPGSGFDLTCRLAAESLLAAKLIETPMTIVNMEGGAGATVYNHVVGTRPGDGGLIATASVGSALLLAQKKFGAYDESAVRWLGAIAADFGAIIVKPDSPYKTLKDLVQAYGADPSKFPVGGAGAIGSQDWMKLAMVARAAGVDPRKMRYVVQNGGASAAASIAGGHIAFYAGDAAEMGPFMKAGTVRVLSVFAPERLPGILADVPTAKEEGYDFLWPSWRGFYMGPKVSDADYDWWVATLKKLVATPEFKAAREQRGLFAFDMVGPEFDDYVKANVVQMKQLAKEAGF